MRFICGSETHGFSQTDLKAHPVELDCLCTKKLEAADAEKKQYDDRIKIVTDQFEGIKNIQSITVQMNLSSKLVDHCVRQNLYRRVASAVALAIFVLLGGAACKTAKKDEARTVISTVNRYIPEVTLARRSRASSKDMAGLFVYPGPELVRRGGPPLSGQKLELSPDKTYRFVYWADVMPPTVCDKGRWHWKGGVITLESDGTLRKPVYPLNKTYVPLKYEKQGSEVFLLMGLEWNYPKFTENIEDNASPEFCLYLTIFEKEPPGDHGQREWWPWSQR